jgi:parallel beta-helix repeat protein
MINASRDNDAGIILKSNMTLSLASGAVLKCITNSGTQGDMIRVRGLSNVTISGPGTVQGDRATHTGPPSEGYMCIAINTSSNITVSGVTCRDSWSDGIYVSDGCANITVSSVVCDNNRRQGMSITSVKGMLVQNSTFSNTHGTDPQCGIDVEPNAGQACYDVHVTGCTFFGNVGGGFQQGASDSDYTYTFTTGTILENSEFYGNGGAGYHDGGIAFSDCDNNIIRNNNVHNNLDGGIKIFQHGTTVTVTGNTVVNNTGWGIALYSCNGSVVTGNTVTGNSGTGFSVDASPGTYTPNAVSGNGK